jgi:hypothetical protein
LQQQAHGAINLQRHGKDKSKELNGLTLRVDRTRACAAVPEDKQARDAKFPEAWFRPVP